MKATWKKAGEHKDIRYEKWQGIAKITINRPEVRNAFRPQTLFEMSAAFEDAREDPAVGVVVLTSIGRHFVSGAEFSFLQGLATTPSLQVELGRTVNALFATLVV